MTPAEKTRLLAEWVMGWGIIDGGMCAVVYAKDGLIEMTHDLCKTWSPLTNLAHAGEVLEAMRKKGWHAVMLCPTSGRHYCDFYRGPMMNRDFVSEGHESLSTAICHAALMAVGVKEEEL